MSVPQLLEGLTDSEREAVAASFEIDEQKRLDIYREMVLEKWSKVPYGKGKKFDWLGTDSENLGFPKISNDRDRAVVAMLMENQLKYQRRVHKAKTGGVPSTIQADVTTADEALPTNFALAMVRRAYALTQVEDWSTRQPMPGPTAFVWWIDFLREQDNTNILSNEYGAFITPEQGVPQKAKIALQRATVTANKQLMATTWTLEASEDAMAQMGLNIEQEMISEFTAEFVRNRFHQHLAEIMSAAQTGTAQGTDLTQPWLGPNSAFTVPNFGGNVPAGYGTGTITDINVWKQLIYDILIDADAQYFRQNRRPANGIVAGVALAARLQKANTATQSSNPSDMMENDIGITDFGTFTGRFHIWATDLLPDNQGFLYRRNPDPLRAGHIYAPYVPISALPAVYGGYSTTGSPAGAYLNTDEYTRNIRERSATIVTKPYAYIPLLAG